MWESNKCEAAPLESVLLGKQILGCSVMRQLGGSGIDTLQGHRDKAKLKWCISWLLCQGIGT